MEDPMEWVVDRGHKKRHAPTAAAKVSNRLSIELSLGNHGAGTGKPQQWNCLE